jgi:hypothetical protein
MAVVFLSTSPTRSLFTGRMLVLPWLVSLSWSNKVHPNNSLCPNYAWSVQRTSADIVERHLVSGGGSGLLSLPYVVTPFQSITQRAIEDNSMIWWIMNNSKSAPLYQP